MEFGRQELRLKPRRVVKRVVGWKEDVSAVIQRLPARFTLRDVYRFVPDLHRKHPENRHIRDKIRQQLQVLRDENVLQFINNQGLYVQVEPPNDVHGEFPLTPGNITTREDLAALMGLQTDDPLRRGMFKPAQGPMRNHLFLFHDERNNPYGDIDEENRVHYVGQGQKGDQTLTSYNRYLAEHLDRGITVHYFVQPEQRPGKILYQGEVVLEKTQRIERPHEGRSVLQFTLVKTSSIEKDLTTEYGDHYAEILEYDHPPGPIERERRVTLAERVARDRAFREIVLNIYYRQCAICGEPLKRDAAIDLQGAHILGVAEGGPDETRNGLSLCVRHHWSFDNGLFSLNDHHKIMWFAPELDPHGEIEPGGRIVLPELEIDYPHPKYLSLHRRKWQFT
jgi:hypothetical protein